jgi:hypothetical protein
MRARICSRVWAVIGCRTSGRTLPDSRKQHPQIVVDLGDRADRRTRVVPRRFLGDRDRRAQAADVIHIRLGHLAQKLSGKAGKALDIPPLPSAYTVSNASELFPDPLTPVKQIN